MVPVKGSFQQNGKTALRVFFCTLVAFGLLIAGGIAFIYSGIYNVAATEPHWSVTSWVLEEARERSVAFHSKGMEPPALNDPKLLEKRLVHFHEMCRLCHGAPGYSRLEFAHGLNPNAPDLASPHVQEMGRQELFWIAKHGIKMTGMPAFGPTHKDDQLWGIVGFINRLPNMKPDEYKAAVGPEKGNMH
jgi:hypothetical protein